MPSDKNLKLYSYILISTFIALLFALSLYALNHIKQANIQQIRSSLLTILTTVQEAQYIWIDQRRNDIRELAARPEIVALTTELVSKHENRKDIVDSKALNSFRKNITGYLKKYDDQGFFLIARDYISIGSMRDENINTINLIHQTKSHLIDRSFQGESVFIPTIVSDVPLTDLENNKHKSAPTMFIASPVRSPAGNVIAVLALRMDPYKQFTRITQLGRIGKTGETYAFDDRGVLITHSRFEDQLSSVNLINNQEQSILNIKISDPGGNLLEGYQPPDNNQPLPLTVMAKSATAGLSGVNTEGYRDYRGVMVFGAWSWEKNYGFGITTEIDVREALTPYYETRNTLVLVTILICILGLILRNFIHRMEHASKQHLKEVHDGLEVRVKERTLELEVTHELLSKANAGLKELAITDGLTGIHNRRYFDESLNTEWQRCLRENKTLAILLFDVDFFKPFNDYYGHQSGDDCLISIGRKLMQSPIANRPGDCIARYGGEEFVIYLSNTTENYAFNVAEEIRNTIYEMKIPHLASGVKSVDYVTVSIGVAFELVGKHSTSEKLLNEADKALYYAKENGRNQSCLFDRNKHVGEVVSINAKKDKG